MPNDMDDAYLEDYPRQNADDTHLLEELPDATKYAVSLICPLCRSRCCQRHGQRLRAVPEAQRPFSRARHWRLRGALPLIFPAPEATLEDPDAASTAEPDTEQEEEED